jgi:hypothetical protein
MPRDVSGPMSGASSTTGANPSMYLGLGVGVGGAILIGIVLVTVQVIRKHKQHRRLVEVLEVEEAVRVARVQEVGEVPRPASIARCSTLNPLQSRAGWNALSSNETIDEPQAAAGSDKRKRLSVSLPKRIKQRGIPLKRLKRLTAIIESPRSRQTNSPTIVLPSAREDAAAAFPFGASAAVQKPYTLRKVEDCDVFLCPGSPKPDVLPSFAIRSPGQYGAGIANNDNMKASRSKSVGTLAVTAEDWSKLVPAQNLIRPPMHARSISLGAPPSRPPSCPVPPLPVIEPQSNTVDQSARQGFCVSRSSISSRDSTGSSVLVTSPILTMHEQCKTLASPSVAQVVAEDDDASLKTVATKQWQNPLSAKGRRPLVDRDGTKSQSSIRSNMARYSVETVSSGLQSSASMGSMDEKLRRLSIPHVGTADQISISRVSSSNSMGSLTGVQKIVTPRKGTRTSVSASGSPQERTRKTSILRDISGNSILPSRQLSNATQDCGRSSNGNPFQWDQPLPKPSAMKGSPNARKGHRRQNCVRISTLTPQILGPPPSRPTSPSIMHGIEEESGDDQESENPNKLRFVSNQRLSRPPSSASFAPNLRIQTLRASLTPSSPTLSAWNAFQEHGLPSLPSDSQLSASPLARSPSRQSDQSSAFTIPSFPSPIKATVSDIQLNQPVPQFCLSRPSTDTADEDSSSPFALHVSPETNIPSSPPLPISKHEKYDPAHSAWPSLALRAGKMEYDPTSPAWETTDPERSSPLFPFAAATMTGATEEDVSPRTLPNSYGGDMPDTPPCSPKTLPEGFQAFFDGQRSSVKPAPIEEVLTSSNASQIMARIPSGTVDFPGAPVLLPPSEPEGYLTTTPERAAAPGRQRAVSNAPPMRPMRCSPPPPMPTIPSSDFECEGDMTDDIPMPSPLHLSTVRASQTPSPQGPRSQPANSVLKNAMALRRMNSEVNNPTWDPGQDQRESRRYVRMGREASPLLPWIGSPDPNESCGDMDELFDFGFAAAGAEDRDDVPGALDEIDMSEVERKLDGALAGFEAVPGSDDTIRTLRTEDLRKEVRSSSVWEDGEKFWDGGKENIESSPLPGQKTTPKKEWAGFGSDESLLARRSIQMTPKSLYDSDGFLRT